MELPNNLKYTNDHVWALVTGDSTVRAGLTEYGQLQLGGEITEVKLPGVGDQLAATEEFGHVETAMAVTQLYMPTAGKVTALNEQLAQDPDVINKDPYGDGWLIEVSVENTRLDDLQTPQEYQESIS
ncbi:glycine cleavage system protein H [Streptomyces sp. NPDC054901]